MGLGSSRMQRAVPTRRRGRKPRRGVGCFLCGGASVAATAAADDSDLIDTETPGIENSGSNRSAMRFAKSSAKEIENPHSVTDSNQASTSIETPSSSELNAGNALSTDISISNEISELHSTPTPNNPSTSGTNTVSEEFPPFSTDNVPRNNDISSSRRSIWESFSRQRNNGRSNGSSDGDLGFYDRLLDLGAGLNENSAREGTRHHGSSSMNRHSRSRMRDRRRTGFHERHRNVSVTCPSGLHPDGMCVCRAFSSAEASISRIVMLTEALFEVLDEIHRHPAALSIASAQAPESVVNSLPSKGYRKNVIRCNDDVEQCYICLTEYEEGDRIRVLPCNHEFHMTCVDKWLKEVHRVCPLCRGNVCQNAV